MSTMGKSDLDAWKQTAVEASSVTTAALDPTRPAVTATVQAGDDDLNLFEQLSSGSDDSSLIIVDVSAILERCSSSRTVTKRDVAISPKSLSSSTDDEDIEVVNVAPILEAYRVNELTAPRLPSRTAFPANGQAAGTTCRLLVDKKLNANFCIDLDVFVQLPELAENERAVLVKSIDKKSRYYSSLSKIISEGDELLEWNGRNLRGVTAKELYKLVDSTCGEVEILVRKRNFQNEQSGRQTPQPRLDQKQQQRSASGGCAATKASRRKDVSMTQKPTKFPFDHLSPAFCTKLKGSGSLDRSGSITGSDEEASGGSTGRDSLQYDIQKPNNYLVTSSFSLTKGRLLVDNRPRSKSSCKMTTMKKEELEMVEKIRLGRVRSRLFSKKRTDRGAIHITLSHDNEKEELRVRVISGRDLLSSDANGFSDPFVKIYLLPGREKENKRKTQYKAKTLNPVWNETLVFPNIHRDELKYKTLDITVWDYDRLSANDFLGRVVIDLSDDSIVDGVPRWYKLENNRARRSQHL